jgi:predicted DNA-binding transcriptional regulator AlpA
MQTETTDGTDAAEQYLPARQVWERYGVTSMSLWRWLRDADLRFPKPMRIGRFRYWRLSDLVAWERYRSGESVAKINWDVEQRATAERVRAPRTQQ